MQHSSLFASPAEDEKKEVKGSTGKIFVHSFDYDGCTDVFASAYLTEDWETLDWCIAMKANFEKGYLVSRILEQANDNPVLLMNASSRQDLADDMLNRYNQCNGSGTDSGSVFQWLTILETMLKAKLPEGKKQNININPFTLTDMYNKLDPGTTFAGASSRMSTSVMRHQDPVSLASLHASFLSNTTIPRNPNFDNSKITLIYAQIHQLAVRNPGKQIEFNFYDDRKDICDTLALAFSTHPELLPNTVTLNIHHYLTDAEKPEAAPGKTVSIQGTGEKADENYVINTKALFDQLHKNELTNHGSLKYDPVCIEKAIYNFKEEQKIIALVQKGMVVPDERVVAAASLESGSGGKSPRAQA